MGSPRESKLRSGVVLQLDTTRRDAVNRDVVLRDMMGRDVVRRDS